MSSHNPLQRLLRLKGGHACAGRAGPGLGVGGQRGSFPPLSPQYQTERARAGKEREDGGRKTARGGPTRVGGSGGGAPSAWPLPPQGDLSQGRHNMAFCSEGSHGPAPTGHQHPQDTSFRAKLPGCPWRPHGKEGFLPHPAGPCAPAPSSEKPSWTCASRAGAPKAPSSPSLALSLSTKL